MNGVHRKLAALELDSEQKDQTIEAMNRRNDRLEEELGIQKGMLHSLQAEMRHRHSLLNRRETASGAEEVMVQTVKDCIVDLSNQSKENRFKAKSIKTMQDVREFARSHLHLIDQKALPNAADLNSIYAIGRYLVTEKREGNVEAHGGRPMNTVQSVDELLGGANDENARIPVNGIALLQDKKQEIISSLNQKKHDDVVQAFKWAATLGLQQTTFGSLWVGNLPNDIQDSDLVRAFSVAAEVTMVHIWKTPWNEPKHAMVAYYSIEDAEKAMSLLGTIREALSHRVLLDDWDNTNVFGKIFQGTPHNTPKRHKRPQRREQGFQTPTGTPNRTRPRNPLQTI